MSLNLLILGRGKTGSLVAEIARERGHEITLLCAADNLNASALSPEKLRHVDVVVDFTTPQAVMGNIEACVNAGKDLLVGTTGWYGDLDKVRQMVEKKGTGFLYGANFSIGINLLFEAAQTAAGILQHHYSGQIFERHHAQKKDAPSGTAATLQKIIRDTSGKELEITEFTTPCRNIRASFAGEDFKRISQPAHPGWARVYAKVLQVGNVQRGDIVTVTPRRL